MAKDPTNCKGCGKSTFYVYINHNTGEVEAYCQKPDCQWILEHMNLFVWDIKDRFLLIDEW